MHAYMLYLPEEWLWSSGLRSFPLDRPPMLLILEGTPLHWKRGINCWLEGRKVGESMEWWMIPMPKCV